MRKSFNVMANVGKVRHMVNFHDGKQTPRDGSPFFDVRTFSNKRARDRFTAQLLKEGYSET